jgi:hypothetical protein
LLKISELSNESIRKQQIINGTERPLNTAVSLLMAFAAEARLVEKQFRLVKF